MLVGQDELVATGILIRRNRPGVLWRTPLGAADDKFQVRGGEVHRPCAGQPVNLDAPKSRRDARGEKPVRYASQPITNLIIQ